MDKSEDANSNVADMAMSLKVNKFLAELNLLRFSFFLAWPVEIVTFFARQTKKFGKRKSEEIINAKTYIIGSSEQASGKKSKKQRS